MRDIKPKVDEYMEGGMGPMKPKKAKPRYPTMSLSLDVIPEAKKWDVSEAGSDKGTEYTIEVKVKMIGISMGRYSNSVDFELRGIETGSADEEKGEGEK